MATTFCYAIGAMVTEDTVIAIKIGITSSESLRRRLKALQTGSPFPLVVLGLRRFEHRAGAARFEGWTHRLLSAHAMQGEWLRATPIVEAMVRRSFADQFMPNWYDANCYLKGHDDCDCRAPQWRCA